MKIPNPITCRKRIDTTIHLTLRHSAGLSARCNWRNHPAGGDSLVMTVVMSLPESIRSVEYSAPKLLQMQAVRYSLQMGTMGSRFRR